MGPDGAGGTGGPSRTLLDKATVPMTVLAQDPSVVDDAGAPVRVTVPVPGARLARGPRGPRFHVVDVNTGGRASAPVVLTVDDDAWTYRDRWSGEHPTDLAADREFRAQNVYAVAARTLALFERHLGRPVPWYSGQHQLFLVPQARAQRNAFYSREHNAVLFGYLPTRPALYTALSYDIVAHEVTHAVLDGLRPRFTEPGLPDQLAFHEALADLVAMLSVFDLDGVAEHLLDAQDGHVHLDGDADPPRPDDTEQRRQERLTRRAAALTGSPLLGLAEQMGAKAGATGRYPALRRSVTMPPGTGWAGDPAFDEPHRRAEVLVAAFLQTFVRIWAGRLEPLRTDGGGLDRSRVAEEGVKAARHLLGMILRALDYLPPVELEFGDVLDAVLTADERLSPDDDHSYRSVLTATFAAFGIGLPAERILDVDRPPAAAPDRPAPPYPPDGDVDAGLGVRYEHLNFVALRASPDEVFEFVWNNAAALGIDVRFSTRVERVLASTRVGPDGLVVNEVLADYVQTLRTTADRLPPGIRAPAGLAPDAVVELWGGGVLVFDQFGRFRLHQRRPLLDLDRQNRRLAHLVGAGVRGDDGSFGASDGAGDKLRFALLHCEDDA